MKHSPALLRGLALAVALLAASATAQAPGDARVALVIGNSAYASAPALANPANDARAMGETLRGLGFTVVELRDGSKAQMAESIAKVRDALKGRQGIGMLYYAGHGLQMDARNYMVPVDARMARTADVPQQTVDVSSVIEAFKAAGNRMNILVLDACRDNPFGGITTGRGLAPLDAPSGTFLAYATAPGNVAEDGDVKSGNGLYTQFLLQELKKPQARIEDVFKRVRFAVRKASNGRQIPWESTSLEEDFQFNDGRVVAVAKPSAEILLAAFTQEQQDWSRIKDSRNADDFYAFLARHPSGTIAEAANAKLDELVASHLVVQGAGADRKDLPYSIARYRLGDEFEVRIVSGFSSSFNQTGRVTSARDGKVLVELSSPATGAQPMKMLYDTQGGFIGMPDSFTHTPPAYLAPSGLLQVGQSWKTGSEQAYQNKALADSLGKTTSVGQDRVVAREQVTVPAGTFDAFRIESESTSVSKNLNLKISATRWVVPDLPEPVKAENVVSEGLFKTTRTSRELVRYTRAAESADVMRVSQEQARRDAQARENQRQAWTQLLARAQAGDAGAMADVARRFEEGKGMAVDMAQAVAWYRKSAQGGSPAGMGGLGAMYYNGQIGAKDAAQAQPWWNKGAQAGDGRSMAGLALLYETGEGGMPQDAALSLEWLGKAAATGDARALYRMGLRLREGQGVEKDLPKSFEMFRRSAGQEFPAGQYMLGWSYFKGLGVAQDEEKAAAEFAKAAEGGIAHAMNDLGTLYQRGGGGLPNDPQKAMEWFRKAAALGQVNAIENVKKMEARGFR
ncbi:caspase family protein [Variovorax terrae]|uniref:Caspase family protein n=1 Tax=Variovorax terrae TaxID=2923278 RepID=A0A9X1VXQ4_9BURK|nr:caspase family protein [Variovorax terrae]MCJ0762458.1 caspase family protein [Variovorax terrae]